MWNDLFVLSIPLADKVVRTIAVYLAITVLLRLIVMFALLPRISEEGAWTLKATVLDIVKRTQSSITNTYMQIHIKWLRKQARRREKQSTPTTDGSDRHV